MIAHRGFSARAPENTLAAVRAALAAAADAVEWDLHVASCGTPVLFHDDTLDRTTDGLGPIARESFRALRERDAGGWFDPAFSGERIPSLAEALEAVRPSEATVYPEVKGFRDDEDLDRLVQIVAGAGMTERTLFISLDFDAVDHLARAAPKGLRVGYVVARQADVAEALDRAAGLNPPALLDLDYRLVLEDPEVVPAIRARGPDVAVWTVDDLGDAAALVRSGIRRITTNQVASMVRWTTGHSAPSPGG